MNITQPADQLDYRGFAIVLSDWRRRQVCSYTVRELRHPCRDFQHGMQIIDEHLAARAERPAGSLRVVAADVGVMHGLSAGQCRRRSEQASARQRVQGRFA
ncbi:hypothetical protein D3875_03810 [Deinococcus cavernae]|uniref:Uncharacterized protein n=1 Tax=Deinococcus cavernae TaxID=2320857 RepID=A0A418VE86_9DEIO|nr:hypothetical protein [Deinococcus cavernae]RJF74414.1 hypothetical protein D3875_03810 [Deinococcus cavernae]